MKTTLTLVVAFLLSFSSAFAQQDKSYTVMSGGVVRSYLVHEPASMSSSLPVVMAFHGDGGTSAGSATQTGLNAFADQDQFLAVYPQGIEIGGGVTWNTYVDDQTGDASLGDPNAPDDIKFVRDVIADLAIRYQIDTKRVFATGHSSGGYMCYALALLASDAIKAVAPVSGNLQGAESYLTTLQTPGRVNPIPVMHIHGTADGTVDYPDPDNVPKAYEEWPLYFVSGIDCGATTYSQVVPIMTGVDKLVFCGPPIEVCLIRIQGMGHSWTNGTYPTTSEIVKFFGLTPASDVATTAQAQFPLSANPVSTTIKMHIDHAARIELINAIGVVANSSLHEPGSIEIPVQNLSAGMYLIRIVPLGEGVMTTAHVLVVH